MEDKFVQSKAKKRKVAEQTSLITHFFPVAKIQTTGNNVISSNTRYTRHDAVQAKLPTTSTNSHQSCPWWTVRSKKLSKVLHLAIKVVQAPTEGTLVSKIPKEAQKTWITQQTLYPPIKNRVTAVSSSTTLSPPVTPKFKTKKPANKKKPSKKKIQSAMTDSDKNGTKRDKKQKPPNTVTRSMKIRIYPTKDQQKVFHRWFGIARVTWNDGVDEIYKNNHAKDCKKL